MIPLKHHGEGRYQFGGSASELDEARNWFVRHITDFDKGNIVIEQFDYLHRSLHKLNGRVVQTKLRALWADKDVTDLINPDYSHLTSTYFDNFPYERGWKMAPEVYYRVPVEVLDAVHEDTFESLPSFARQRVLEYRATANR